MTITRRTRFAAAAMVLVAVAASGSTPVSADVVAPPGLGALPSALRGDFNSDGRPDIVLAGASGWNGVGTALRTGSGGFAAGYGTAPAFAAWASLPGVKIVTGRFDGDADDDILLTGLPAWNTLKLARSNGNGTFTVTEPAAGTFPALAAEQGARVLSGDFNADGRTDLALVGGNTSGTIPLAMANADGTFTVTSNPAPMFAGAAGHWAARVFAGDLNADGRTDLVSVPDDDAQLGDLSLSIAYSTASGGFTEASLDLPDFVGATYHRQVVAGDYNNDNRMDLAVVLSDRILTAYSLGAGSFALYRGSATTAQFHLRATRPGARIIATDNNCDGRTDLVVISEPGGTWNTMPVAMPWNGEDYTVMDDPMPDWVQWSRQAGAQLLSADYDGDGCEDLALTGGTGWNAVQLAVSNGDGSYHEESVPAPTFAGWAAGASPVTLPPSPDETLGFLSLLDTGGISGIASSMAVGTDGLGIISYWFGSGLDNLRVAHCEDIACTTITTKDVDTVGNVGRWSSIKIGSDGLPLISYISEASGTTMTEDLKVAHCNDIVCTSATVTTLDSAAKVNDVTSLGIGADGFGLIAYQDTASSASTKMKVAHCTNIACTAATLTVVDTVAPDNGGNGGYSQIGLAVGNHGLGLIAYYDGGSSQALKVAACTNAACSTTVKTVVDRKPSTVTGLHGGYASLTFGIDGLALIAYNGNYSSATGSNLKVAHCLNVYCTASTVINADTGGFTGWNTVTTVGADGLGVISYYDATNKDLKVAHCNDLACGSATNIPVDAFDDVGLRSSIAVGPDGLPLISYQGPGPNGTILRVVRCGNAPCTAVIVAPF